MAEGVIRIATRTSALALWQANYMADRLRSLPESPAVELVRIVTSGDQNQTDALRQFGGTGVFTREVQKAVLDGRADIAVHSLKDLPTQSADGLKLACVPERAPRCDALLLPAGHRSYITRWTFSRRKGWNRESSSSGSIAPSSAGSRTA